MTKKSPVRATSAEARMKPSLRSVLSKRRDMSSADSIEVPESMSCQMPSMSLTTPSPPLADTRDIYLGSLIWRILLSLNSPLMNVMDVMKSL